MKIEKAYLENPFIKNADVRFDNNRTNVVIKIDLNFETLDADNQSLILVFEKGGVIFKKVLNEKETKKEMVKIEPGFYIRKYLIEGET
jgi:hypothetical protein